ncbi:MAG: hypothetical protein R3F19_21075 [Verrucomicrobiales bacterium]
MTTACCVEAPLSATARQEQLVEKGRESAQAYYAAGGHDHDHDGVPLGPGGMNWRAFLAVILVLKTLYHFVLNR